jgi:hypothetical protein
MHFVPYLYAQQTEGLRDIQPPVDLFGMNLPVIIALAVFFAVVLIGVLWFLKYRKKKSVPRPVVVLPAHVIAYQRLETLKKQQLLVQGKMKEYFTVLSDIVRRYLEGQFQISAPEMTTEEFLWSLNDTTSFVFQHRELLRDFLVSCDLVKFAKYGPTAEECEHSFNLAKRLIDETSRASQLGEGK